MKYLLSPQDLAAYALVPELIDAGVSCFKIEGRLKTPEYVANITRHYRRAIDAAAAGRRLIFTRARRHRDGAVVLARLFARLARRVRSQDARAGAELGEARRAGGRSEGSSRPACRHCGTARHVRRATASCLPAIASRATNKVAACMR